MRRVTFPNSEFISPGRHQFHIEVEVEEEFWWMGNFIETKTTIFNEIQPHEVPDMPGQQWTLFDRTWTIVSNDDESFWGEGGKAAFLTRIKQQHIDSVTQMAEEFGWDLDENFNPLPGSVIFSKSELEAQGKTLMAHIMAELNIFPSVGQARKNGWDKPLELGEFTVTKKKIRFKVVE